MTAKKRGGAEKKQENKNEATDKQYSDLDALGLVARGIWVE